MESYNACPPGLNNTSPTWSEAKQSEAEHNNKHVGGLIAVGAEGDLAGFIVVTIRDRSPH